MNHLNKKISRRQFIKYGLAGAAGLTAGGYLVKTVLYKGGGATMAGKPKYKKVLVLGVDGMDPKVTDELMADGRLPNLSHLVESGSFMGLDTSYPPNSPVAWTSIATGCNPGKHNIFDFIRRDPKNYLPQLSLSKSVGGLSGTKYESFVKAESFWSVTSKAGIPTTIIRWPVTFPAQKVNGFMLGGLGVPDIKGFLSGYTYYTSRVGDESGKESNKVVGVKLTDGLIEAEVAGPKTRRSGELVDVTALMKVKIAPRGDSVEITLDGVTKKVTAGEWSDWLRARFKVGVMKTVSGIFKAYLIGTDPFEMYVTAVQVDPEDPVVDISYPAGYSAELAEDIGLYYTLGMPEETDGYVDDKLTASAFLAQVAELEGQRDRMFSREFERLQKKGWGVLAFVYDSSDRVQHVFWDNKVLAGDGGLALNDAVADYYSQKDAFIGQLLGKIDEDTLLMIISDHGFTSFERSVSLNRWLVDEGFMTLKKDIGDEEGALFKYVDWSKTRAYAVGFNSVYVNLAGREGKGVVDDREGVVSELVKALEDFKDDELGGEVVYRAYRREEVYSGDFLSECPDITLGFAEGYRMAWQTAIGGFTRDVLFPNVKKWSGTHLIDPKYVPGVLFSNVRLNKKNASQMDVAPTVLDALGLAVPGGLDGGNLLS
jgi:predicted AlkP superfamily phosphohydrolase/phosphomutase